MQDIYNLQANNPNKESINPSVMRDEIPNILRNQKESLEKNAINKEVDLYKDNNLKRVGGNTGHPNNDSSGRGGGSGGGRGRGRGGTRGGARGGGRGSEHRNRDPQTHGGQGNSGSVNNFQDDNIKYYL